MEVTVVGAGIIGLTTALALEARGHDVRIVAKATGAQTTSAIAGAVWFPYRAGPPDKVALWAARTRRWLIDLAAREPSAGIDVLTGYTITTEASANPPRPWWAALPTMEGDGLAIADGGADGGAESINAVDDVQRVPSPVAGQPDAWRFTAPRAQPSLFLPWLEARLRRPIERRVISDLTAEPGDAVINCTGLGARELASDPLVYPLLGQIVIAERGDADTSITVTDDRIPDAIFYMIPRRDELVLGGCSIPFPPGAEPEIDEAITRRIVDHAGRLGIAIGTIRTERVGLRPFRAEVRLERDPSDARIIHNYGHGGAGFTLCHGCAEDVVALLSQDSR